MDKFDITKHKWNGELFGIEGVEIKGSRLELNVNYENFPVINKGDAIAIAKHFGIIDEVTEITLGPIDVDEKIRLFNHEKYEIETVRVRDRALEHRITEKEG